MESINSILPKQMPDILSIAISLSNAFNALLYLDDRNINTEFPNAFVPAFFLFFVPPLVANIVYCQFTPTPVIIGCFFVAVVSFPFLRNFRFFFNLFGLFSVFGRALLFVNMKNNFKNTFSQMFLWLMTVEFIGTGIKKYVGRERNKKMEEKDFFRLLCEMIVLHVFRTYKMSDYGVMASVVVINMWYPFKEMVFKMYHKSKQNKEIKESESLEEEVKKRLKKGRSPANKTPVRKAAIEAQINNTPRKRTPRKAARKIEFEK